MLLSDLAEIKSMLYIAQDDPTEDVVLGLLIETASSWIQEILNRDFERKSRTEFPRPSGTMELILKERPVYTSPLPVVYEDDTETAFYGSNPGSFDSTTLLTYGEDFCLKLDWDSDGDGVQDASRSGILVRINQLWDKPVYRQVGLLSPFIDRGYGNIKVVYMAGYTVDTLPSQLRTSCAILVSKLRQFIPVGSFLTSESYEERSVGYFIPHKHTLLHEIWPMIATFRNQYMGGSV